MFNEKSKEPKTLEQIQQSKNVELIVEEIETALKGGCPQRIEFLINPWE